LRDIAEQAHDMQRPRRIARGFLAKKGVGGGSRFKNIYSPPAMLQKNKNAKKNAKTQKRKKNKKNSIITTKKHKKEATQTQKNQIRMDDFKKRGQICQRTKKKRQLI